jgi:hypothetical protein
MAVPPKVSRPKGLAMAALVAGLQRVRASTIDHEDSQVSFTSNLFRFVMNTNLLVSIEGGTIDAELADGSITFTYSLGTVRIFIIATAMALLFTGLTHSARFDLDAAAGIGFMAWLWLFGGNYLITLVRFRWFVKRCVREAFARWGA